MQLDVNIDGIADLEKRLTELGAQTGAKVLRSAMMSATTVTVKAMKSKVPVHTGDLKASIRRKASVDKKGKNKKNTATIRIGAIAGGKLGKGLFKANWVEFGYQAVGSSKKGGRKKKVRFIAPRPFIRPVFDAQKEQIVERFATILKKRIEKAAKK